MSGFALDKRLADETVLITSLQLCDVLLRDDARLLWVILVPRREDAVELHDLDTWDQVELMRETVAVSEAVSAIAEPTKINTGALGNIVRQLHIHVVARHEADFAWPGPIWGVGKRIALTPESRDGLMHKLRNALL